MLLATAFIALLAPTLVGAGGGAAGTEAGSDAWPANDHACVAGAGRPVEAWPAMANPVLSSPTAGLKDEAVVWLRGRWHLLFSEVVDDPAAPGGVRWQIGQATSADLLHWSAITTWPRQPGTEGVASPDVVRDRRGTFVVTYQSDPGETGARQDRLYYRTSADLERWSAPRPLAHSLAPRPDDRMIDGALAWSGRGLLLAYKSGLQGAAQHMEVAWSPSGSLDGPWRRIGAPAIEVEGGTVENYEVLQVGGRWRLVATSNNLDQPWFFTLLGDPRRPAGWLHWSPGRMLQVPAQGWDSGPGLSSVGYERANSAFLCMVGGTGYLFYAGSSDLTSFGGWGHAEIGVARSPDLLRWRLPPG